MGKVYEYSIKKGDGNTRPATAAECEALADHNWQNFKEGEKVFTSSAGLNYDFLFEKYDPNENGLDIVYLAEIE